MVDSPKNSNSNTDMSHGDITHNNTTHNNITDEKHHNKLNKTTKELKKELEKSEKEKALILDSLQELVSYQDKELNIRWANNAACKSVNLSHEELIGKKCYEIWHNRSNPCENCPVVKALATGQVQSGEVTSPDGRHWNITGTPVHDEKGNITGIIETTLETIRLKETEKKVNESYKQLNNIIEALPYATFVIDNKGRVIQWNDAMESMTGISNEDILGKNNYEYSLALYGKRRPMLIDLVLASKEKFSEWEEEYDLVFIDDNNLSGESFVPNINNGEGGYLRGSASKFKDDEGNILGAIVIMEDITYRKQVEEKVEYLSFYDSLTGHYNRDFLEEEIKRLDVKRQLPLSIVITDLNGLKLVNDAFGHHEGDKLLKRAGEVIKESCRSEDIIARWAGDEFTVLLPLTPENKARDIAKRIKQNCKGAFIGPVPLKMAVGYATKTNMQQDINMVLKNSEDNMYKNKIKESSKDREKIISSLLESLKEKSDETEDHIQRLIEISSEFGQFLGLGETELDRLVLLASVHDIGKIVIPADMFSKSRILSDKDWETIKNHTEAGYQIARSSENFGHIAEEILSHHERWDGKGYPQGLEKEKIPYLARIMAILDAYDVMTAGKPYKESMTQQEALSEIANNSWYQFDPDLANFFIRMLTRFFKAK